MNWLFSAGGPLTTTLRVLGGLGVFLFGMQTMSRGIHNQAGERSRKLVGSLTSSPAKGIITGTGLTGLIQSSSAVTVILVSMVNAGLLSLTRSIPVIMGANIGTTFTAWIVSFLGFSVSISSFALPVIAFSLPFHFSKNDSRRQISRIMLGFGLLFLGLNEMKVGISVLQEYHLIPRLLTVLPDDGLAARTVFVLIGTILTLAVQSSSAAMTITLTLVYTGDLPFSLAAAIILGENIGTTITAYLAATEMSLDAKRCARAHFLFNLIGVIWMFILLSPVLHVIDILIPGPRQDKLTALYRLAAFHTLFNVANTMLLVWFIPQIEKITAIMIPDRTVKTGSGVSIPWVRENLTNARGANLINARGAEIALVREITSLADYIMNSLDPLSADVELNSRILVSAEKIVSMDSAIHTHLTDCALQTLTEEQSQWIATHLRVLSDLERMREALMKIHKLGQKLDKKSASIHGEADNQIMQIAFAVHDFVGYIAALLEKQEGNIDLKLANSMEEEIDSYRSKLNRISRKSIKSGGDVKGELLFMEIVRHYENLGDLCLSIVKELSR